MEMALLSWVRWILLVTILSLGTFIPGYEAVGEPQNNDTDIDTYMVLLEGPPIVGYKGDIPGLRGTAKYFTNSWKKHHGRYAPLLKILTRIRRFTCIQVGHSSYDQLV